MNLWHYEFVHRAVQRARMKQAANAVLSPDVMATRGAVLTILYRMAGEPAASGSSGPWYDAARSWAVASGLSDGKHMDSKITREQLMILLYRYTALQRGPTSWPPKGSAQERQEALRWAADCGLMGAEADGPYSWEPASRREVCTALERYCRQVLT